MPEVRGPDGQRYQFPEGTSPEVMRQAMAKRYPKPESQVNQIRDPLAGVSDDPLAGDVDLNPAPNVYSGPTPNRPEPNYNQRVMQGLTNPEAWQRNTAAAVSGINNLLYASLDDEIAGFVGDKTGAKPLQNYEAEQDRLRAERPFMFQGGQMIAGLTPTGMATMATGGNSVVKNALAAGSTNAAIGLPHGYNDADAPGQNRLQSGLVNAGIGGVFGAALGGGGAALSKNLDGFTSRELEAAAGDLAPLDGQAIRPQSIAAFNRLLSKSGLSNSDIARLHSEVSNRQSSLKGLPAGAQNRKRAFQHYMEVLAEDEGSALYNPQAAANILMTVQERANNARPGDGSRGIVGAAVKADRASQVPFLEDSAQNVAQGSRIGTGELVESTRKQLRAQYDEVLDPSQISEQGQQAALEMIESIRPLLDGPSGLKVQAAAEGVPIDELIARNPMKALHWIQSAARRKAQSSDPNRGAYAALRSRALPVIENNVPAYRALRKDYASNEGLDKAKTFGDKLFGGANSQAIQNPGMRAELVKDFNSLTDLEKQAALVSIRDKALGRISGGADEAPARLSSMNDRNVLDFLEQIGQKDFADDIRAIGRENQLLSVADAGNPLRQSATFSNAQARAEAPALYQSGVANAVDNSTPGTLLGEGMLMAFAPHYQGAYAAYRGGRLAASMGLGTRKKTLEDMTRFLMSRNDDLPANALAPRGGPSASTPAVQNALAPQVAPSVQAPQPSPVNRNGLGNTTGGAVIGGVSGGAMAQDLDGDGEVSLEERYLQAAGGAVVGAGGGRAVGKLDDRMISQGSRQVLEGRANPMGAGSKGALPMDEASRMARAREMGFDTEQTYYHATNADFDQFKPSERGIMGPGVYLSKDPKMIEKYVDAEGARIIPVHVRGNIAGKNDPVDPSQFAGRTVEDQTVIFDPKNIRSKYATFDPSQSESPVLTAGIGGRTRKDVMKDVMPGSQGARVPGTSRPRNALAEAPPAAEYVDPLRRDLTTAGVVGLGLAVPTAPMLYSMYKAEQYKRNQPAVSFQEFIAMVEAEQRRREGMPPAPSVKPQLPQASQIQ